MQTAWCQLSFTHFVEQFCLNSNAFVIITHMKHMMAPLQLHQNPHGWVWNNSVNIHLDEQEEFYIIHRALLCLDFRHYLYNLT